MMELAAEAFGLLGLDRAPVAMKFSLEKPAGLAKLEEKGYLCSMITTARERGPFYADADGQGCQAGSYVTGLGDIPLVYESGQYAVALGIMKTPKAMQRVYRRIPRIEKGRVSCISFAPLDRADFEPDVVVVTCTPGKAFTLLRAYSYESGKPWKGESSGAMACAWAFVYPYIAGEINICVPSAGMLRKGVTRQEELMIAIPAEELGAIVKALREMPIVLPHHGPDGREVLRKIRKGLGLEDSPGA